MARGCGRGADAESANTDFIRRGALEPWRQLAQSLNMMVTECLR